MREQVAVSFHATNLTGHILKQLTVPVLGTRRANSALWNDHGLWAISGIAVISHRSRSHELPRLSSQKRTDQEQPLTQVTLHASLLGSYMLKGVPGVHVLGQVMPQEIYADLQATSRLGKVQKMQRGKTTCVAPPDLSIEPWAIEIPFIDIFSLPLLFKSQSHSPLQA